MDNLRRTLEQDAAFAFVELGLSEEEFFRQTPRQWQRRFRAWEAKDERENRRFARVCMVLAWCHGNPDATEDDFIPHRVDEEPEQTPEDMIAVLKAVTKYQEPKHGQ